MCFEQFIQSGKILKAGYLSSEKASLVSGGGGRSLLSMVWLPEGKAHL